MLTLALLCVANMAGAFFFSLAEAALLSCSEPRIRVRMAAGQRGAARLLALKQSPGRIVSTIVFCNNLFMILGTALITNEAIGVLQEGSAMAVFIGVTTVVMILFTELLPKVLGQARPEAIGAAVAPALAFLAVALAPFVWVAEHAFDWLRPRGTEHRPGQEGEIVALARMGQEVGHLDPAEAELIHRIFRLDDIRAWDVMTPRYVVQALPARATLGSVREALLAAPHAQLPVYEPDLDRVTGVLVVREALAALVRGEHERTLESLARPATYLPSTRTVDDVLRDMQAAHGRLGIVVDEFGVTQGVVTMDDLVEELVGEAIDAQDISQGLAKRLGRGSALVHGLTRLGDVARFLSLPLGLPPDEEVQTVAGLLQERLGRIPEVGDSVALPGGLVFTVEAADARMALRVKATGPAAQGPGAAQAPSA
jgi:CBS domain containing-hemolysin-like protein